MKRKIQTERQKDGKHENLFKIQVDRKTEQKGRSERQNRTTEQKDRTERQNRKTYLKDRTERQNRKTKQKDRTERQNIKAEQKDKAERQNGNTVTQKDKETEGHKDREKDRQMT